MKQLLDYLNSFHPLTENQKAHIEFLVKNLISEAENKSSNESWLEGHKKGFKQGELQGRINAQSMSAEELEDFYKEREE